MVSRWCDRHHAGAIVARASATARDQRIRLNRVIAPVVDTEHSTSRFLLS
jgi:hypothetical protein